MVHDVRAQRGGASRQTEVEQVADERAPNVGAQRLVVDDQQHVVFGDQVRNRAFDALQVHRMCK